MPLLALPLFGALAMGLGMTAPEAQQWWRDRSSKERDDIVQSLDYVHNNKGRQLTDGQKNECYKLYEESLKRCEDIYPKKGKDAYFICKQSATTAFGQCFSGLELDDRRELQIK